MKHCWCIVIFSLFTLYGLPHSLACDLVSQFQCSTSGTCIDRRLVCDHFENCGDDSDEQHCPFDPVDMTTALVCTIHSNGGPASIVKMFGNPDDYVWKLRNGNQSTWPIHRNRLYSVTFPNTLWVITTDYATQQVYYGNNNQGRIEYGPFVYGGGDTAGHYYLAAPVTKQVNGIVFDWVAKNTYWTDGEYKLIGMAANLASRPTWKIIVSNLTYPRDVVVDPLRGYLFWSDGNGTNAKIERSDLGGNNRMVLMNSTQGLVTPTTLVVDFTSQRLYWLDAAASTLGAVNVDGSSVMTWSDSMFARFSAMAVHSKYLYFGSSQETKIYIYDKGNATYISNTTVEGFGGITDMAMFSSESQPLSNTPCATNKGQCSDICLATSATTRVCDCPLGFVLASDGLTCNIRPYPAAGSLLFVAEFNHRNIYQIRPETGEIRALMTAMCSPSSLVVATTQGVVYSTCQEIVNNPVYRIRRRSFDGKIDDIIYSAASVQTQMMGLALDTGRGLLYYTDNIFGVISEIRTDGTRRREIINNTAENPHAIVVDTSTRRLYWTDCSVSPTIQTMSVDGTNRRTLVTGDAGSCFTDLAIDFDRQLMYWTVVNDPAIEMATLNGTQRVKILTDTRASYSGITLMGDVLFISDRYRRNVLRLNASSGALVNQGPGIFANISDVKFFNFTPVPNMSPTTEALTPASPTATIPNMPQTTEALTPASPTATSTQVGDQLAANGFNVTTMNIAGGLGRSPTTSPVPQDSLSTTSIPSSTVGQESKLALIVGIVVGVGGFIITVVVVIVCIMICLLVKKNRRNNNSEHDNRVIVDRPSRSPSVYDEIRDGDVAMAVVVYGLSNGGYNSLKNDGSNESIGVYLHTSSDYRATIHEDAANYLHFEQHVEYRPPVDANAQESLVTGFDGSSIQLNGGGEIAFA